MIYHPRPLILSLFFVGFGFLFLSEYKHPYSGDRITLHFPGGLKITGKITARQTVNHLKVTCEKEWDELNPFQAYSGITGRTSDGKRLTDDPVY